MFGFEYKKRLQSVRIELANIVSEMDATCTKPTAPEYAKVAAAVRSVATILIRVIDSIPG